ncbi:MAG: hypothetical protein R3A10_00910 [Caldilineaceae bacterium]
MLHATLVRARRSIRRYDGRPVAQELLHRLPGRRRSGAVGPQPATLALLRGHRAGDAGGLERAMGARWHADLTADGADPAFIARRVAISQRVSPAPVHSWWRA